MSKDANNNGNNDVTSVKKKAVSAKKKAEDARKRAAAAKKEEAEAKKEVRKVAMENSRLMAIVRFICKPLKWGWGIAMSHKAHAVTYTIIALVIVGGIYVYTDATSKYVKINENNDMKKAESARLALLSSQAEEKTKVEIQELKDLQQKQIITLNSDGIKVVYNAADNSDINKYRQDITKWAKDKHFDGIIFGRVQPTPDGKWEYATFDGKNGVPLQMMLDKLESCKNVASLMGNLSGYWLPAPVTEQVNGRLRITNKPAAKFMGIFSFGSDNIISFRSDNFSGQFDDGTFEGNFIANLW